MGARRGGGGAPGGPWVGGGQHWGDFLVAQAIFEEAFLDSGGGEKLIKRFYILHKYYSSYLHHLLSSPHYYF
jgi:hypothetical protein